MNKLEEKKLDILIKDTIKNFKIKDISFDDLKELIEEDYEDSDISLVEESDIIEIIDASI